MVYIGWDTKYLFVKDGLLALIILISEVFQSRVCLILWLDTSVLTYLHAYARGEITIPSGYSFFALITLCSAQFVTKKF